MNDLTQHLGSLQAMAPAISAITLAIVGLSLWCVGRKTLRAATCVMGGILGVFVAGRLVPLLPSGNLGGLSHHTLGLIVGGVLGVVAAIAFFRVVMAGLGAGTFGGVAMLITLVGLGVALPTSLPTAQGSTRVALDGSSDEPPAGSINVGELTEHLPPHLREKIAAALSNDEIKIGGDALPEIMGLLQGLREGAANRSAAATETWEGLNERDRATVLSAGLVAGLIGLLLGAITPVRTASFITSMAGGALWMGALGWLVQSQNLPAARWLEQPAWVILAAWGVVTLIGVKIQMSGVKRESVRESARNEPRPVPQAGLRPI